MPVKKGGHYFYTRNSGLQNQSVLFVRDGVDGAGRVADRSQQLVEGRRHRARRMDAERGRQAARLFDPGRRHRLAHRARCIDVATGKILPRRAQVGQIRRQRRLGQGRQRASIIRASRARRRARPSRTRRSTSSVYFHKLGTRAGRRPAGLRDARPIPSYSHGARSATTAAGWSSRPPSGTDDRYDVTLIDLSKPGAKPRRADHRPQEQLELSSATRAAASTSSTNKGAPLKRVVAIDVAGPAIAPRRSSPRTQATLDGVST